MTSSTEQDIDLYDPRWEKTPRRFVLYRHEDMTGPSGTGVVATGVLWHDGSASIQWLATYASVVYWPAPNTLEAINAVHGHVGMTQLIWIDPEHAPEGGYREPETDHS